MVYFHRNMITSSVQPIRPLAYNERQRDIEIGRRRLRRSPPPSAQKPTPPNFTEQGLPPAVMDFSSRCIKCVVGR